MANVMKCARCGKLYEWKYSTAPRLVVGYYSPTYGTAKHDICDDCTKDLNSFINGAKIVSSEEDKLE